jgi:excisionase family DNA binding protein
MQPVQKIINYLKTRYKREVNARSLESKAYRLGLESATLNSNWMTTTQIAEVLGIDRTTVVKWFKNGVIKKEKYVLFKRGRYVLNLEDFMKWLKNNQSLWDSRKVDLYALGEEPKWLKEKRKRDLQGFKKAVKYQKSRTQKKMLESKTILEIQEKHKGGLTYKELAKQYFVSVPTVARYLKYVG